MISFRASEFAYCTFKATRKSSISNLFTHNNLSCSKKETIDRKEVTTHKSRVQEPKWFLPNRDTRIVQQSNDTADNRARGGCSKDTVVDSSDWDDVVGSIGRDICFNYKTESESEDREERIRTGIEKQKRTRESTRRHAVVVLRARIRRLVVLEVTGHRSLLIRRNGEDIAESTTTVDNYNNQD